MEKFIKVCPEIALTGGPSGGKTTSLSCLSAKLQDWGFRAFVLPEIATMIFGSGIPDIAEIIKQDPQIYLGIEKRILLAQMALRQQWHYFAALFPNDKRVIVSDRGASDVKAYVGEEYFMALLEETGFSLFDVRDSYDVVAHLVTAAIGAEKFYTLANNKARTEDLQAARDLDEKTKAAWVGSPHLRSIDNSTDFEGKIKRVLQAAARGLGIPVPLEIERKFLLSELPDFKSFGVPVQEILIEQYYLMPRGDEELRIRRRSQWHYHTYYETRKKKIAPGVRHEMEKIIKATDYLRLLELKDPSAKRILKIRHCFLYKNQYFELDSFIEPRPMTLLEIELTEEHEKLELPPFLKIIKEVTGDDRYSNATIARQ